MVHQENAVSFIVQENRDEFVNLPIGFGESVVFEALLVYSLYRAEESEQSSVVSLLVTSRLAL